MGGLTEGSGCLEGLPGVGCACQATTFKTTSASTTCYAASCFGRRRPSPECPTHSFYPSGLPRIQAALPERIGFPQKGVQATLIRYFYCGWPLFLDSLILMPQSRSPRLLLHQGYARLLGFINIPYFPIPSACIPYGHPHVFYSGRTALLAQAASISGVFSRGPSLKNHSGPSYQAVGFSLTRRADNSPAFPCMRPGVSATLRRDSPGYIFIAERLILFPEYSGSVLLPTRPTGLHNGMALAPGMLHNTELSCLAVYAETGYPTEQPLRVRCWPQSIQLARQVSFNDMLCPILFRELPSISRVSGTFFILPHSCGFQGCRCS